jgi:hypothetical protein
MLTDAGVRQHRLSASLAHLNIQYLCMSAEVGLDQALLTNEYCLSLATAVQSLRYLERRYAPDTTCWEVDRSSPDNRAHLTEISLGNGRRTRKQWLL